MTWIVSYIIAGLAAASQTFSPGMPLENPNRNQQIQVVEVSNVDSSDETESFEQTYPLNPNGKISISNVNGPITIEGWDRDEVKVKATKTADSRERLEEVKIEIDAERDHLSINTHFLPWNRRNHSNKHQKLEVAYHLMVPRGAVLDEVEAVNGNINISGVNNVTKVSAVNGTVKATNLRGTASLSTVNGVVTAEFDSLDKSNRIDLSTVNGKAYLVIPSDSNATIKADSVNGLISNDFGLTVRKGKYVGRDLYGKVGDGSVKIFLESVNGPLTITRLQDGKSVKGVINLLPAKSEDDPDDMDMDVTVNVDASVSSSSSGQGGSVGEDCPKVQKDCAKVTAPRAPRAISKSSTPRVTGRGSRANSPNPAPNPNPNPYPAQAPAPMVFSVPPVPAVPLAPAVGTTINADGYVVLTTREQLEASVKALEAAMKSNSETLAKNLAEIDANKVNAELVQSLQMQNRALELANRALKIRIDNFKKFSLQTENYTSYGPYYSYSISEANSAPTTETVSNSFQTKDKPKVIVDAPDTEVVVRGWDKKEVKYTLTKISRGNFKMTPLYEAKQDGSTVNIVIKPMPLDRAEYQPGKSFARSRVEIYVPRKADLKINTSREMRVEGVTGKIELIGAESAINVRDSGGELAVSTDCGDIRVIGFDGAVKSFSNEGLTSLEGDFNELNAATKEGKIILTLADDANVNIESNRKDLEADGFELEEIEDKTDVTVWKVGSGGAVHRLYTQEEGQVFVRNAGKLTGEK